MQKHFRWARIAGPVAAALVLTACAYQVGYEPDYVPPERPLFVADGKLLIVLPQAQRQLVYEGPPASEVGNFTTLTVPFGTIMQDIAGQVFNSCFARGVEFADNRADATGYVLALEENIQKFVYSYTRMVDQSSSVDEPTTWLVPQVQIAFEMTAYDAQGKQVLKKTYDSGTVSGAPYYVDTRPAERVNETLHQTLAKLMLQVANDVRPLLTGECDITDLAPPS